MCALLALVPEDTASSRIFHVNYAVTPALDNGVGICRAGIKGGTPEVTVAKDQDRKIGLRLKSNDDSSASLG